MIHLTLPWIKTYAGTDRKFRAGFLLYQKQKILAVEADVKNSLKLTIEDNQGYPLTTSLFFYGDTGTFRYGGCSCHQNQPCEHVLAGLLYVLYKKELLTDVLSANKTNQMYEEFEQVLVDIDDVSRSRHLGLEVIISPKDVRSKVHSTTIQLKILVKSGYMVRNVENFVKAVVGLERYEISKGIIYNPETDRFDQHDMAIIRLIYDYYMTREHLMKSQGGQLLTSLKASVQPLPPTYVYRLLEQLRDHRFNIDYDGLYFRHQQIEGKADIDFYLTEDDSEYVLSVNAYDIYFPLTKDYRYVFYNNQIYEISEKEGRAFRLFCDYFPEKVMEFGKGQIGEFLNKVKPVLELVGFVHMEESLKSQMESYPLEAKLYIEKYERSSLIRLSYHYGPYEFSRFPEKVYSEEGDVTVIHHLEKEKMIERLLMTPNYHKNEQGYLVYDTEEDLYTFVEKVLPRLRSECQIYYSEEFKNTYLRPQRELVSSLHYNAAGNLLELDFAVEGVSRTELFELLMAVREKKHYYKLRDDSFFTITEEMSARVRAIDQRFGLVMEDVGSPMVTTSMANAFYLDDVLSDTRMTAYSESFRRIMNDLKGGTGKDIILPSVVEKILRDYQKRGVTWLMSLKNYGLGGILADDMGLGKTLQAITLMIGSDKPEPSIVVAPTSLVYNWEEEIHKFAPEVTTRVVMGTKTARNETIDAIGDHEIIITSYGSLKRDLDHYKGTFDYCIIDEAQHIKNPKSQNAKAVKSIKAGYKYALTGTPIENTLTELWSIFDFVLPGYLDTHDWFVREYERPIVKENDSERLTNLTKLIQPFILRRLKEDVLSELPPKIETKVSVELNKHQKKLYMAYVEQAKSDISAYGQMAEGQRNMKILAVLTRLRQLCCHPSMFINDYNHGSAKLDLLLELLEESIEGGHRVLVFSQFTSMLSLISQSLEKKHLDYHYLDGSIAPVKRQQMVHDFNAGIHDVFLISLKAGGTGLNLTGADVVIHFDPWWNPAVENQATDRAYRIGQKNRVQVYKLISAGTIEEKIYELQQRKLNLIDNVIKPGETFLDKLTVNELQSLLV